MPKPDTPRLIEKAELRDRTRVFPTRFDAGRVLAEMLDEFRGGEAVVFGIPAGGVPVACPIARGIGLPLDVAAVSKITPPWNSEVGYGAVAFDGTVGLNQPLVERLGLDEDTVREGVRRTTEKVRRRVRVFRGDKPFPPLEGRPAILVDDGLASGWTMRVACQAIRAQGAARVAVAVPTAHKGSIRRLREAAEDVYCANVRSGPSFAVADAYEQWCDVSDDEVVALLREAGFLG